jgi:quinol monooxygenase YgiN
LAYVVIARWTAAESGVGEVAAALEALAGPSREEPGNLAYLVHRDPEDPRVFVLYERYEDEAAYRAHGESDHFQELAVGRAFGHLASREREFLVSWEVPG